MAQQRIRPSKLPEILAQFGRTGPGEAIREGLSGFKEGATLASHIAARKQTQLESEAQIERLKQALETEKTKRKAQSDLTKALKEQEKRTAAGEKPAQPETVSLETTAVEPQLRPDGKPVLPIGADVATGALEFPPQEHAPIAPALPVEPEVTDDELVQNIEEYKRLAFPQEFGKSLFREGPSALEQAKTKTEVDKQAFLKSRTAKVAQTTDDTLQTVTQAQKVAEQTVDNAFKFGVRPSQRDEAEAIYDEAYRKALEDIKRGKTVKEVEEIIDLDINPIK